MRVYTTTTMMALIACMAGGRDELDGGRRDASLRLDGSLSLDGGGSSDAARGSAGDAATSGDAAARCPGTCDPSAGRCPVGACVLDGERPRCVTNAGLLREGMPCEETDQCAAGLACFRRRTGGICGRVCCPPRGDCSGEARCGGPGVLVDGSATDYGQCLAPRPCDVLDPAAVCDEGEGCYIVSSTGDTDCREEGRLGVGESCLEQSDCTQGLFCAGLFDLVCVRICDLSDAESCPEGEGQCRFYAQTPDGRGLCTPDTMTRR